MTQWFVELAGTASDLDNLRSLTYPSSRAQVIEEEGKYVLKAEQFAALTTPVDVDAAAELLLASLNMTGTLLFDHYSTPEIRAVYGAEDDGSRSVQVRARGPTLRLIPGRVVAASASLSEGAVAVYQHEQLLIPETRLRLAAFAPTITVLARFIDGRIDLDRLRDWRELERLLGDLLEDEGYDVTLGPGRKDGGVDLVATKDREDGGKFVTVWQAKRLKPGNRVEVGTVRELGFVTLNRNADRGIIATTTYLTRGALDLVRQEKRRLSKIDRDDLIAWIVRTVQKRRN